MSQVDLFAVEYTGPYYFAKEKNYGKRLQILV